MAAKRVIDVNEASIVDLKAELIRKESQYKRTKRGDVEAKITRQDKKPPVWAKPKKETTAGNSNLVPATKNDDLSSEEIQALQKSRQALEAKSVLYEKMARGEIEDEDDEEEGGRFLVDFHKKVYSKGEGDDVDSEEELTIDEIPPPSGPEEEWVDYVDSLGRARRCLRKDLKNLQEMDKNISARKSPPTLMSEDMRREVTRQKWEEEEEEAMDKPVGPVHYQNVRFEEIRNHGVGYYQFSTSEEQRQEQMKTLDKLREQTMEQRVRVQKLKDKRKAALDARLAKVRERKLGKVRAAGEITDSDNGMEGADKEKTTSSGEGEVAPEENVKETPSNKEEENERVHPRRPQIKDDLPEWARHKIQLPDKPRPSPHTDTRSERNDEFAPPSFYYEEDHRGQSKTQAWEDAPKLLKHMDNYSTREEPRNAETPKEHQEKRVQDQQQHERQSDKIHQPPPPQARLSHPVELPPLPLPPQEYVRLPWAGHQWQPPLNVPPPQLTPWQPHHLPPPMPTPQQLPGQPNFSPWQPYQAPPFMGGEARLFHPYVNWGGNPPTTHPSLTGVSQQTHTSVGSAKDCSVASTVGTLNPTSTEQRLGERTEPSIQQVANFVAQFRYDS